MARLRGTLLNPAAAFYNWNDRAIRRRNRTSDIVPSGKRDGLKSNRTRRLSRLAVPRSVFRRRSRYFNKSSNIKTSGRFICIRPRLGREGGVEESQAPAELPPGEVSLRSQVLAAKSRALVFIQPANRSSTLSNRSGLFTIFLPPPPPRPQERGGTRGARSIRNVRPHVRFT